MKNLIILSILFALTLPSNGQDRGVENSIYNILDYGAINDSTKLSTEAINKAIQTCFLNGGGKVLIPAGYYQSGTILMKSNVELHLSHGAFILGSRRAEDYPKQEIAAYRSLKDAGGWFSLIYAVGESNISITGAGTIDGRGEGRKGSVVGLGGDRNGRPRNILFISCSNVTITGIEMKNSAMWNQHYLDCEDVLVDKIRVFNHCNGNNEGIDIDGCRRFILSNSVIDSDDDGIVLKSTGMAPCEDIVVTGCIVSSRANAIKCGTESTGGFRNINIGNCIVKPTRSTSKPIVNSTQGITGISLEIVDGGVMDGVTINNILIRGTSCPLYVRLGNRARKHIPEAPEPPIGQMRNIQISNITAYETGNYSSSITGTSSAKIENISLRNIRFYNKGGLVEGNYVNFQKQKNDRRHDIGGGNPDHQYIHSYLDVVEDEKGYPQPTVWKNLPSYGLFIRHVKNMSVNEAAFGTKGLEPRIPIIAVDVDELQLQDIQTVSNSRQIDIQLVGVKSTSIDKELKVDNVKVK